jgi:hypothetical protein
MMLAKFAVIIMFLLPIAGMIQHAVALNEAEIQFNRQQNEHRREMNRLMKEYTKAAGKRDHDAR